MASSIFGSTLYLPTDSVSIFGRGTTYDQLTEDLIVELKDARVASDVNVAGTFSLGTLSIPSGPPVIDGVALNVFDRVVLTNQDDPVENGVYKVVKITNPSLLIRAQDFKPNVRSSKIFIREGSTLACSLWFNDRDPCLRINIDPIKMIRDDGGGGEGTVTGIPPTVIGNIAIWADTNATVIEDSGLSITDILAALNKIINVTLINTDYSLVLSEDYDSFVIMVRNLVPNGPSAVFSITKNDAASLPSINTLSSTPGDGTFEVLELRWDANMDLELHKTGPNYDGNYQVTICGSGAIGGGGGGDITDGVNVGGENEVFKQKTGSLLEFRTIEAGSNINIVQNADTLTISSTGGGTSTPGRIAFNSNAVPIYVLSGTPIEVGYFSWDNSEYNTYNSGRITFYAEIGDQEATIELFDLTNSASLGSITTSGTGSYTFSVANPGSDANLALRVSNDNTGSVDPILYGTTLSFQQTAGGTSGTGQIAFVLSTVEIIIDMVILTEVSYFAWDNSEYSGFTNGSLTFNAEVDDINFDIQVREEGGAVLTSIPTITASGVYTFPLNSLPSGDSRLVLETIQNGAGSNNPMIFGTTLRFDQ